MGTMHKLIRTHIKLDFNIAFEMLRSRYLGTFLGVYWGILNPVLFLALYALVFTKLVPSEVSFKDQILYMISGFIPWTFLSQTMDEASSLLLRKREIVKRSSFDFTHFIFAGVFAVFLLHLGFLLITMLAFDFSTHDLLGKSAIFLLALISFLFFNWGIGLILASLSIFFRDLSQIVPLLSQTLIWCSPIFWMVDLQAHRDWLIFKLNPLTYFILCYRDYFIGTPDKSLALENVLVTIPLTLVSFGLGLFIFKRLKPHIPDQL